jgi:hypothetical protein
MNPSFERTLVDVWRQVLVENATVVELGGKRYSVRITPRKGLRQVDFVFDGNEIRGLEQNPDTKSRWAQLARAGNLTQNQGHSHGCYHQFRQPSEGIRRSNCRVQFDEQRIGDE